MSGVPEEDRFPVFFLGAMSAAVIAVFGIPFCTWIYCLLSKTFQRFTQSQGYRRKRYGDDDDDDGNTSSNSPWGSAYETLQECLKPITLLVWASTHLSHVKSSLQLQWRHRRLFTSSTAPRVYHYCIRWRFFLLLFWFLSVYLHMTTIPRAAHYEVLGLPPTAGREEVRSAYRKLSFRYHPDKDPSADAKEIYAKIRYAYQRLTGEKGGEDDNGSADEEIGMGVALPKFLRDTENEGRTLFLLLLIAFGLPAWAIYYFLLQAPKTYQKCHTSLTESIALASHLSDYMGVPEKVRDRAQLVHVETVEKLLRAANLWRVGLKPQDLLEMIPVPLPHVLKICQILQVENYVGKRAVQEAKDKLASYGFDEDESRAAFVSTITSPEWVERIKLLNTTPWHQLKGYDSATYRAPTAAEFDVAENYYQVVLTQMKEDIAPFDIQGKSKKLFKLYEEKILMLRRLSQMPVVSASLLDKLFDIDEEVLTTHMDIERSAMEYLSSGHRRSYKKQQQAESRKRP